ncbi:MAG: RodZ domain-containing protein [Gammaproteobacteria bacterium]
MNNSETTEPASPVEAEHIAFGESLHQAREARGLTLEEVSSSTHLSVAVIDAIEKSDIARLPPPTFVQGYLRIYARFLGLSESTVVNDFNRAIPHQQEAELHPRSTLPSQATSHSPLMRSVTVVLLLFAMLALVYGAYDYYVKTAETMGQQRTDEDATALQLPEYEQPGIQQHAVISDDGELIVVAPDSIENDLADFEAGNENSEAEQQVIAGTDAGDDTATVEAEAAVAVMADNGLDTIELRPRNDSWVEIVDATNKKLYHNLVQKDQVLRLQGVAPFDVFLGNAPAVQLLVNGIEVKMTRYIRRNNVARFSVSTGADKVIFH